ncbi:hypothetical protein CEP53_007849 [Fusarium sp. AF-6]|nr:hypothetical protein CEP53_007849 [Fusarium sp. AF-6]
MSQRASGDTRVSSQTQQDSPEQTLTGITVETPLTEKEIHIKPWKFIGYKGYSEFISSEDDWFVLRRFGVLNVRVALALQDEVAVLEEQLKELDATHSQRGSPDLHNGRFRKDVEGRRVLIEQLSDKLYKYNAFVLQQSKLRGYPDAPHRDIWRHKDKTAPNYDARHVYYSSDARMDKTVSVVIVAVGIIMLITPIWALQAMDGLKAKLGVITAFVLIFLLVLSFAMASKPFEALGATAAYAAVLMVFTQLGTSER